MAGEGLWPGGMLAKGERCKVGYEGDGVSSCRSFSWIAWRLIRMILGQAIAFLLGFSFFWLRAPSETFFITTWVLNPGSQTPDIALD